MPDTCASCGDGESLVRGISVRTGCGRGAVWFLDGPEPDRPYVLVTQMTDPNCLDRFADAAAVITDQGSILCHAAVIAREFGTPCVVGTVSATTDLKVGQHVIVCGTRGVVLQDT